MQPSSVVKLRSSHRVRWLVLALALATVGLAACGDESRGETGAATTVTASIATSPPVPNKPARRW